MGRYEVASRQLSSVKVTITLVIPEEATLRQVFSKNIHLVLGRPILQQTVTSEVGSWTPQLTNVFEVNVPAFVQPGRPVLALHGLIWVTIPLYVF